MYAKPASEAVYDPSGLRLDRTPTDDEINWLWDKVRTCLSRESQSNINMVNSSQASFAASRTQPVQPVQVSHQHIDGNSLAPQFGVSARISSAHTHSHTQPVSNGYMPRKVSADSLNSYTKRMSLLQQRKQQSLGGTAGGGGGAHKAASHAVTTTYQPMSRANTTAVATSQVGPTPSSVAPTPSIATATQEDGKA